MLTVEKRVNEIINRLNKTRVERRPDLQGAYIITDMCVLTTDMHMYTTSGTYRCTTYIFLPVLYSREGGIKCGGEGREEDAIEREGTRQCLHLL